MRHHYIHIAGCSVLFALTAFACVVTPSPEKVGTSVAALRPTGDPPTGPIPTSTNKPPPPPPVTEPIGFEVRSTTSTSATLTWEESGKNTFTTLYRQSYDLSGNAVGSPVVIYAWEHLAGAASFTDDGGTFGVAGSATGLLPDRQYGYQLVEQYGSECTPTSCDRSLQVFGYTRDDYEYPAGRIQLVLSVSPIATAAAPSDHVNVSLGNGNSTWLGSSGPDFTAGSNIGYDLITTGIGDRSDINSITITTPDSDGLCITELTLLVDGAVTYDQVLGTVADSCQWVYESGTSGGSSIVIPFAALRSNPSWATFAPTDISLTAPSNPNQLPTPTDGGVSNGDPNPVFFAGYDAQALVGYLDAVVSNSLRDPSSSYGSGARLSNPTSTSRIDDTHLSVLQHITGISYDDIGFTSDPSYELVIHNDAATCGSSPWCVTVEDVDGDVAPDSTTTIVLSTVLGVVGDFIGIAVTYIGSDLVADALTKMSIDLPGVDGGFVKLGYCFPVVPGQGGEVAALPAGNFAGGLTVCPVTD